MRIRNRTDKDGTEYVFVITEPYAKGDSVMFNLRGEQMAGKVASCHRTPMIGDKSYRVNVATTKTLVQTHCGSDGIGAAIWPS